MTRIYNELIANFGAVERVEIEGRAYYKAPLMMLIPGVLSGTKGPLLYTAAEIKNSVTAWEGTPITLNHPKTAADRVIIGVVKRPRITNKGGLKAEAYIDVEKATVADPRIIETLKNNQKLEVSTGLYARNEEYAGSFNGKEYVAIARNYVPDHLAILPDAIGACSVDDGCGLNVNKKCSCSEKQQSPTKVESKMKDLISKVIQNSNGLYTADDEAVLEKFSEERLTGMLKTLTENSKKEVPTTPPKKKIVKKVENKQEDDDDSDGEEETGRKRVSNVQAEIKKYMKNLSPEDFYEIAPPEVKEVLSTAKRTHNERKAELISNLTAHCTTEEMRESLTENFAAKDIEELELLANAYTRPERSNDNPFAINYVGNAGSPRMTTAELTKKDREDYLPLPVMNWNDKPAKS